MKTNICSGSILLPRLMTVALLLLIAGISGCDSSTNAQSAQQKWTGEWELKNTYSDSQSENARIILTPEGKAYLIGPYSATEKVAYEIPLKKVSENTTLPANIKVVTVQEQMNQARTMRNIARLRAGKTAIGSMNRAQQAYYLENDKFSASIEELGLGIKPETEDYIFKIVPQSNPKKSVMNIAQAKREGLKSYVGLVYVVETDSDDTTIAKLCETSEALSKLPQMPEIPKNSSEIIKCPSGFTAVR